VTDVDRAAGRAAPDGAVAGPSAGPADGQPGRRPVDQAEATSGPYPGPRSAEKTTDRAAAFAAGPSKIPRTVIVVLVIAVTVLGLGGVALDHFFPGPVGISTTTTLAPNYPPPLQTAPAGAQLATGAGGQSRTGNLPVAPQLPASAPALMDLQPLNAARAPGFSLTDQHGRVVSLATFRGKVVVLSFFDAACDDICPVLERELSQADLDLGRDSSRVAMLTVNTDPLALSAAAARPAEVVARAPSTVAWYFLTGALTRLDAVWSSYGIAIDVQRDSGLVSHNDFLYFIDPSGRLRFRATPFADENTSGVSSLPVGTEATWAAGIAAQAKALLGGPA
jgi:cytochrome oxidase Cu insertion factor (SCO1/SenC/PrrC family)